MTSLIATDGNLGMASKKLQNKPPTGRQFNIMSFQSIGLILFMRFIPLVCLSFYVCAPIPSINSFETANFDKFDHCKYLYHQDKFPENWYWTIEPSDSICILRVINFEKSVKYLMFYLDTLHQKDKNGIIYWESNHKESSKVYKYKGQYYYDTYKLDKADNGSKIDSMRNWAYFWKKSDSLDGIDQKSILYGYSTKLKSHGYLDKKPEIFERMLDSVIAKSE